MRSIEVGELVRASALARGESGREWLERLAQTVTALADRWQLDLGPAISGGTAGHVVVATGSRGESLVLKIPIVANAVDRDDVRRSVVGHQLAAGRGCAVLVASSEDPPALLLERLGPNLADLATPVDSIVDIVAETVSAFRRPVPESVELPTGAAIADRLSGEIVRDWESLGEPCGRAVIDRATDFCGRRADAFDRTTAVLAHGDAHGWNTLRDPAGGHKFVDVGGMVAEPAQDLAVVIREYNESLLGADPASLVRARVDRASRRAEVDPDALWEWGFIERVSTGLANARDFGELAGRPFLDVATRCL